MVSFPLQIELKKYVVFSFGLESSTVTILPQAKSHFPLSDGLSYFITPLDITLVHYTDKIKPTGPSEEERAVLQMTS